MTQASEAGRRTRVTRPYPTYTLEDSLSVARAIYEVNAGLPFDRELLAGALGTTPKSSAFTMRLNASAAYGLTEGGYNDPDISLTELGETVVASSGDPERGEAVASAAMKPDTFGRFYELFDGRRLPQDTYLHNILQRELGVRADLAQECLAILRDNGEFAGIISESEGEYAVRLPAQNVVAQGGPAPGMPAVELPTPYRTRAQPDALEYSDIPSKPKKIFVAHIGDSDAAEYVTSMLREFGIESAGARISEDDAGPLVPQEAAAAMRECSAAILVFPSDDSARYSGYKMIGLLGAASVLFDDRMVILREDDAQSVAGLDGLQHIDFDAERPGESGLNLLVSLHKAGVLKVSA